MIVHFWIQTYDPNSFAGRQFPCRFDRRQGGVLVAVRASGQPRGLAFDDQRLAISWKPGVNWDPSFVSHGARGLAPIQRLPLAGINVARLVGPGHLVPDYFQPFVCAQDGLLIAFAEGAPIELSRQNVRNALHLMLFERMNSFCLDPFDTAR